MNKGGNAGGQGAGGGVGNFGAGAVVPGPTASAAAQAAQRQRSLLQRADADIGSLLDNFSHLLKAARVRSELFIEISLSRLFSVMNSHRYPLCPSTSFGLAKM